MSSTKRRVYSLEDEDEDEDEDASPNLSMNSFFHDRSTCN